MSSVIKRGEKDLDKLYKYFAYKTIQIIVQSRLGEKIQTYSKSFFDIQDWFNLSIINLPDVSDHIREHLLCELHKYEDDHNKGDHKDIDNGVYWYNKEQQKCHPQNNPKDKIVNMELGHIGYYPNDIALEISLKTLDSEVMAIEVWHLVINYEYGSINKQQDLNTTYKLNDKFAQSDSDIDQNLDSFSSSSTSISTNEDNNINEMVVKQPLPDLSKKVVGTSTMSEPLLAVYNKLCLMLKSLITLSRILPGYKLSRLQNKEDSSFVICYRFVPAPFRVTTLSPTLTKVDNDNNQLINVINLGPESKCLDIGQPIKISSKCFDYHFIPQNAPNQTHTPKRASISLCVHYRTHFTFSPLTKLISGDSLSRRELKNLDISLNRVNHTEKQLDKDQLYKTNDYSNDNVVNEMAPTPVMAINKTEQQLQQLNICNGYQSYGDKKFAYVYDDKTLIENMFNPDNYVAPAFASKELFQETFYAHYKPCVELLDINKPKLNPNVGTTDISNNSDLSTKQQNINKEKILPKALKASKSATNLGFKVESPLQFLGTENKSINFEDVYESTKVNDAFAPHSLPTKHCFFEISSPDINNHDNNKIGGNNDEKNDMEEFQVSIKPPQQFDDTSNYAMNFPFGTCDINDEPLEDPLCFYHTIQTLPHRIKGPLNGIVNNSQYHQIGDHSIPLKQIIDCFRANLEELAQQSAAYRHLAASITHDYDYENDPANMDDIIKNNVELNIFNLRKLQCNDTT